VIKYNNISVINSPCVKNTVKAFWVYHGIANDTKPVMGIAILKSGKIAALLKEDNYALYGIVAMENDELSISEDIVGGIVSNDMYMPGDQDYEIIEAYTDFKSSSEIYDLVKKLQNSDNDSDEY